MQVGGTHTFHSALKGYTNDAEAHVGRQTGACLLRDGALQQSSLWSIIPPRSRTSDTPLVHHNALNTSRIYLQAAIHPHGGVFIHHKDTLIFDKLSDSEAVGGSNYGILRRDAV